MKAVQYYLIMGAAVILPGAFVLLFLALARRYYRAHREQVRL